MQYFLKYCSEIYFSCHSRIHSNFQICSSWKKYKYTNCCLLWVNYSKRAGSIGASTRQNTPRWVVTHPLSPVTGITYAAVFTGDHTFLVHPNAFIRSALRSDRSPCLILDIRLQVCVLKFLRSLYGRYQFCMFTVSVVRYR